MLNQSHSHRALARWLTKQTNRKLVLIILTSLLGNIIISFLHNFVPLPLVSITDAIAAIVVAILAVIWAIVLLIGAIIAIIKAIH